MNFQGSFGGWLKQQRKALDLTQVELAGQVGCTVTTIQKMEAGLRRPSKQIAALLMDVLALSPDERVTFISFARRMEDHSASPPFHLDSLIPASNLPLQSMPFIGREVELAQITTRLADPNCRLLTLVGAGGIGKTRLGLQAAAMQLEDFADGAYFVSLAPVGSPTLIADAIAKALQLTLYGQDEPTIQVINHLRSKHLLLVLDNFEHLLPTTGLLTDLLANAPRLKLLVTSRERLKLLEEWVLLLEGLPFPPDLANQEVGSYSAVRLFMQTAYRLQPNFTLAGNQESVIDICRAVEGMPLGLELAATWLRAIPCDQIVRQIKRDLDFLTTPLRDVPNRHSSLRAVFEHSWNLLLDNERSVLMKLSVFRGGIDPEAAKVVAQASLPLLAGLVDKSLLRLNAAGRYDMHELLRQFAEEKLEVAGETVTTAHNHFFYFVALAEQAETHLYDRHSELWIDRLELEHDNLRAAFSWSLRDKQVELGLRLGQAVWSFWEQRGYTFEASTWFEKLLALTTGAPARLRATALRLTGCFVIYLGDDDRARMLLEEGLRLAREVGDKEMIAWNLNELGFGVEPSTNLNRAVELLEEQLSLFRELHHAPGMSHALRGLSWVLTNQGDYERARLLLDEMLVLAHHADDKIATAWATFLLGNLIWFQTNDSHRALALYQESLTLSCELRNEIFRENVLFMMGQVARFQKDYDRAQAYCKESLAIMRVQGGGSVFMAHKLAGFAGLIGVRGFPEQAAQLYGATDVHLRHLTGNYPFGKPVNYHEDVEAICAYLGQAEFAAAFAKGQAMTLSQALNYALEIRQASDGESKAARQPVRQLAVNPLTERELEILHLIVEGMTNHQIAANLFLAVGTVKFYASQIYGKLQVQNRIQAMARARELNLLS